jgi:hypothetical protein
VGDGLLAKCAAFEAYDFSANWQNELKSTMSIVQTGDPLSGTCTSAKSSAGTSTKGKLTGYVDGKLIAFVVHWDDFQAITSWVGQLAPKGQPTDPDVLNTLWQMTKAVAPGDEWASINAGADSFGRI